jgi:hypothetical protein
MNTLVAPDRRTMADHRVQRVHFGAYLNGKLAVAFLIRLRFLEPIAKPLQSVEVRANIRNLESRHRLLSRALG